MPREIMHQQPFSGALNIVALSIHYPMLHLLTVSLVFSFGAGVVAPDLVGPKFV